MHSSRAIAYRYPRPVGETRRNYSEDFFVPVGGVFLSFFLSHVRAFALYLIVLFLSFILLSILSST